MIGLTGLHPFAAARGEGLMPELLDLFRGLSSAATNGNVEDIARHRGNAFDQAGPNPIGMRGISSTENVLLFPTRDNAGSTKTPRTSKRRTI